MIVSCCQYLTDRGLKRSFQTLENIWKNNQRHSHELSHNVASDIFVSNENYPSLFPSSEVQVKAGYVKRYLENSE